MSGKILKLSGYFLLLAALGAGIYYALFLYQPVPAVPELKETRQFNGRPVSLEGNVVTLNGIYGSNEAPVNLDKTEEFSFIVDETTKFRRKEIFFPKWEDLAAGGATSGTIDYKDLPKTEGEGSLDDFKKTISTYTESVFVIAEFSSSIYQAENPAASSVYYELMIIPTPPGFDE